MQVGKLLFAALGLVITILVSSQTVLACSCAGKPTVLDSFEGSAIVVATKLISVEKVREKEREHDIGSIRSARMLVEKVYKGNVKEGDILTFAQGGGADCIWTFEEEWVGSRFLYYLGKATKGHPMFAEEEAETDAEPMYHAVTCGRSNSIKAAKDDLSYLDNMKKVIGKTRLSGDLGVWFDNGPSFANLKIKVIAKSKTYETKTDKDGFYEIYDLPPGDYLVKPTIPFGWKINDYMLNRATSITRKHEYEEVAINLELGIPITVKPKRHAALDLIFDIDTAIIGRILSPAGKPMKDVCVMAVSTELQQGDHRGQSDCTNEKGEFRLDEMDAGNYIVVVNYRGKIDGDVPFGTLYYPGVADFKNAGAIRVDAGKYVRGIDIQIPQTVETVEISGLCLYANDKPVVGEDIKFQPDDTAKFDESSVKSDASGRFTIRIPKGASGKLVGDMYTYKGEFKNCPVLDKLISDTGTTFFNALTDHVELSGDQSKDDLKLVFPFPYCEKAEDEED
jgi:hypothetical protein